MIIVGGSSSIIEQLILPQINFIVNFIFILQHILHIKVIHKVNARQYTEDDDMKSDTAILRQA